MKRYKKPNDGPDTYVQVLQSKLFSLSAQKVCENSMGSPVPHHDIFNIIYIVYNTDFC